MYANFYYCPASWDINPTEEVWDIIFELLVWRDFPNDAWYVVKGSFLFHISYHTLESAFLQC